MNKIHPLIILGLLSTLVLFTYFQKNSFQKQLELENKKFSAIETELKDIQTLKIRWENTPKKLDAILKQPDLSGSIIKQEDFKTKLVTSIDAMTSFQMKFLTTKILNGYIDITKLSLKKENDKVSALVEIEK